MTRIRVYVLLWTLLAACCPILSIASQADHQADRNSIQQILDDFISNWNKHDMKALCELFTDDAEFVTINARYLKGRKEIFDYHDDFHKKGLTSQRKGTWEDLQFLRPDVAYGHIYFEPASPGQTGRGSRTALALVVMSKKNGTWKIVAFQNVLKYGPPLPEQTPEGREP